MVKDICSGTSHSWPAYLTAVGNTLYFRADDGVHGYELWKSDGTLTGTVRVADIYTGTEGSEPEQLTDVNGMLFFVA